VVTYLLAAPHAMPMAIIAPIVIAVGAIGCPMMSSLIKNPVIPKNTALARSSDLAMVQLLSERSSGRRRGDTLTRTPQQIE
jgi:hypothetical protein